eukprot:364003-Chlamydomonas_euryale.AAC.49
MADLGLTPMWSRQINSFSWCIKNQCIENQGGKPSPKCVLSHSAHTNLAILAVDVQHEAGHDCLASIRCSAASRLPQKPACGVTPATLRSASPPRCAWCRAPRLARHASVPAGPPLRRPL